MPWVGLVAVLAASAGCARSAVEEGDPPRDLGVGDYRAVDLAGGACGACPKTAPLCDTANRRCVACLSDVQCSNQTTICKNGACVPGCSAERNTCGTSGVCDVSIGKCVACLPTEDRCPAGKYCVVTTGTPSCQPGCKSDEECQQATGGTASSACCGHQCVDTASATSDCGKCGTDCGTASCCSSACCSGSCCNGMCIDTANDLSNCGFCGNVCSVAHGTPGCRGGNCTVLFCSGDWGDCDGSAYNGCETDLDDDSSNCGGCGDECVFACISGSCFPF